MRKDILTDEDGDLMIVNGDFYIGESDEQHISDLFLSQPGEYKRTPMVGFGASSYLKRNITEAEFRRNLKIQLDLDGYENALIDLSEGIPKINITL